MLLTVTTTKAATIFVPLSSESPADSLKQIHKVHSMWISWTIEFLCYCCWIWSFFSHLQVFSSSLSYSCFRSTESQRTNIQWTKEFFSDLFLFSSRANSFKNKSVFFSVRSPFSRGEIHLHRIASNEKKNVNYKKERMNEKKNACRNIRNVPCTMLINIHFVQGYFYVSFRFGNRICIR